MALLKASGIPLNYTTPLFQIQNQRALFKRWKKYQHDNGIEPQVTLYEMRHTFVSIESGVLTDSQLKMLVGHSKNMDTAGVYRHELDGQREDLGCRDHRGIQEGSRVILVTHLVTLFFVNVAKYMGYKPTTLPF